MFCLRCGTAMEERTFGADRLEACTSCDFVHFDAPVPVAAAIVARGDEVLLARPHYAEVHVLVSGFVHPFESVEEAAVREVREETGYDVEVERFLGSYSCRPMGLNQLLAVCVARVVGGSLQVQESELADARWVQCRVPARMAAGVAGGAGDGGLPGHAGVAPAPGSSREWERGWGEGDPVQEPLTCPLRANPLRPGSPGVRA